MSPRKKGFIVFIEVLFGLSATAIFALVPFVAPGFQTEVEIISLSENGHERANTVAYSPDGSLIAVGASSGIYYFDTRTYQVLRFVPTETWVRSLAFSPDGSLLATGSYDPIVRLWQARDGKLASELAGHTAWVRSVAFSPDGDTLATASDDDTVRLWDLSIRETALTIQEDVRGVRAVTFSPDGTLLATGGSDNAVRLWRVDDGSLVRELNGHKGWVRSLAFSPDGRLLASGGFDADILLWQVENGNLLKTLDAHSSSVLSLAFSPDGNLLASGSVDETVRLWQMPQGDPYDLLIGHSDFVFGVAFSPDGKNLVSGGVDNSIRIWPVVDGARPAALELISSPSSCVVCHHSPGPHLPPRVPEPSCATCHGEGALVINWCPWFPRSPGDTTLQVTPEYLLKNAGVPHISTNLGIALSTPGNGEHLYSLQGLVSIVPVRGYVFSSNMPLQDIEVTLEIWSPSGMVDSLSTNPQHDGSFSFSANIRPVGNMISMGSFGTQRNCMVCHTEAETVIPAGDVRLVVYATAPDGTQAYDERLIKNDYSTTMILPVHLVREDGQPAVNIPVQAVTRLYEWRERSYTEISNAEGWVNLEAEMLSTVPTIYKISIPPVVIGGTWYESIETANVILNPGETEIDEITIQVRERTGRVEGQISGVHDPLQVYAIHLPDGEVMASVTSDDGKYAIPDLPIGQYMITLEEPWVSQNSVHLEESPSAVVDFTLSALTGNVVDGRVTDSDGEVLPFAWVSAGSNTTWTDPASGSFDLYGLVDSSPSIIVGAPGFYSQAHLAAGSADSLRLAVALVRRPETEFVSWGMGQVFIPPETIANEKDGVIIFEQGWLWGHGEYEQPLVIRLNAGRIMIDSGKFALERLPGASAWFYLFEGNAAVSWDGSADAITMAAGEMIYLGEDTPARAVQYQPVVVRALVGEKDASQPNIWQPSLDALLSDWTARTAILLAQIVTIVVYLAAFVALFAFPLVAVNQVLRKRKARRK